MPAKWTSELESAFNASTHEIIEIGKYLYNRGWLYATSGNLSSLISTDPTVVAITESGTFKGNLKTDNIIAIDSEMNVIKGKGKPSSETLLHLKLEASAKAGAVLHTHSVWSNVISSYFSESEGIYLSGYEMLKALNGVKTHEHEEFLPIIENNQDMKKVSIELDDILTEKPGIHGLILRKHGLYTWGRDLNEALRHLGALEYLLESEGRLLSFKDK